MILFMGMIVHATSVKIIITLGIHLIMRESSGVHSVILKQPLILTDMSREEVGTVTGVSDSWAIPL